MRKRLNSPSENMIAREELQDQILQVNVPETEVVEVKDSQRKVSVRPSYPGYVLVNTTHELGARMWKARLDKEVGHLYKKPQVS